MTLFAEGVSLCGCLHPENQDAFCCRRLEDGWVLAVSDGVGSKRESARGSRALCGSVMECARKLPDAWAHPEEFVRAVHQEWLERLAGFEVEECCATMLILYIRAGHVLAVRLGDGFIGLRTDGQVSVLFDDKGDGFVNETDCLNRELDWSRLQWLDRTFRTLEGAVLCSDGVEISPMTAPVLARFTEEFTQEFAGAGRRQVRTYLETMLENWTGHDDKTMVCLLPGEGQEDDRTK